MLFIYNCIVLLASFLLKIVAIFSPKVKLFVAGRRQVFDVLSKKIKPNDQTIWFHAASLGEYEQGLPVIEKIKLQNPNHKIIITFFSPSGFEVRKNNTVADVTVYLPLDTFFNAKKFIALVHPDKVFFIKYEFWLNYLHQLKSKHIKTYLISGVFRQDQVFFKWFGGFYRNALLSFDYFFVQNETSKKLLQSIGFDNVKISGDTRFDRVVSILERNNTLNFMDSFTTTITENSKIIVCGSSWLKDEALLVNYINQCEKTKFVIAPHNIISAQIKDLKNAISKKTILYSEIDNHNLADFQIIILDTIGILTKIYSYADIAFVGGGFGNPGVHNILEPATFGVPIVIGPNFSHFSEATALVNLEGCMSISNQLELNEVFDSLLSNDDIRYEKGHICSTFVQMNKGATDSIIAYISQKT